MLFNSYEFLFAFLPVVLAGFFLIHRFSRRLALAWVTAASLVFYGYWDYRYLALIVPSIIVNCALGYLIARRWSRAWLIAGVAGNLMVIGWFKYSLFLFLVASNSATPPDFLKGIVLPLGISFFTFQQISYLVNVWRGHKQPARLELHAFIVLFFPHLIAGPLVLYENFARQVRRRPPLAGYLTASFKIGLLIFAIGLFKKVAVADSLAPFANTIFSYAARPDCEIGANDAWLGALAYSLQLYFDFSGYSDMAIGLGRMFGFRLPINFSSPYKAESIIDFWRRWHITLSYFFRNYVYIPMGGNRKGTFAQVAFIMTVFFLTGLRHGAGWTFILWGVAHGILVVVNHLWLGSVPASIVCRAVPPTILRFLSWMLTLTCVVVLWVFFKADSLAVAGKMLKAMFSLKFSRAFPDLNLYWGLLLVLPVLTVYCRIGPNTQEMVRAIRKSWRTVVPDGVERAGSLRKDFAYMLLVGGMIYLPLASISYVKSQFLYFNF